MRWAIHMSWLERWTIPTVLTSSNHLVRYQGGHIQRGKIPDLSNTTINTRIVDIVAVLFNHESSRPLVLFMSRGRPCAHRGAFVDVGMACPGLETSIRAAVHDGTETSRASSSSNGRIAWQKTVTGLHIKVKLRI